MAGSDDYIPLSEILAVLFKRWKLILFFLILGIGGGFVFNHVSPRIYEAHATFFLDLSEPQSGGGLLGGYSQLFSSSSDSELKFISIIQSDRIKSQVISHVRADFKGLSPTEIAKILQLKTTLSIKKDTNNLYRLSMQFSDPNIALKIVQHYLSLADRMFQSLELTSRQQFIKVLDVPKRPTFPVKPMKTLNLLGFSVGTLILGLFLAFFLEAVDRNRDTRNLQ